MSSAFPQVNFNSNCLTGQLLRYNAGCNCQQLGLDFTAMPFKH